MARSALVLEDSKTQAQIMCRMIENLGWAPLHCEDVPSALHALRTLSFGALFIDIYLGGDNALLHVDSFRAMARSVPLVLMTAGQSPQSIDQTLARARKSGADHVLRKPFSERAISAILATLDHDAASKRRHVMVVDDCLTVRSFVRQALTAAGHRVSEAATMENAFAAIPGDIDLVLCDIFMPGMGGLAGLHQIKTTWPHIKVISMSAGLPHAIDGHDALDAARKLGADAQLSKPFTPADLCRLTESLLNGDPVMPERHVALID